MVNLVYIFTTIIKKIPIYGHTVPSVRNQSALWLCWIFWLDSQGQTPGVSKAVFVLGDSRHQSAKVHLFCEPKLCPCVSGTEDIFWAGYQAEIPMSCLHPVSCFPCRSSREKIETSWINFIPFAAVLFLTSTGECFLLLKDHRLDPSG
jgi:hypothetical protein